MKLKAQIMDEQAMKRALMRISHEIAEKNGLSDMTLAEINAEIAAARRARTSAADDGK